MPLLLHLWDALPPAQATYLPGYWMIRALALSGVAFLVGLLLGRPIIETEYSSALGAPGDIMLADLSQYTLIDKGGINAATSMHIAFLTDEMVFRITYRTDGKPMWKDAVTPFKGSNSRSPFVTIAQR